MVAKQKLNIFQVLKDKNCQLKNPILDENILQN
jgi:hypothetical protein